jgi:hypothetical protein
MKLSYLEKLTSSATRCLKDTMEDTFPPPVVV